MSRGLDQYLANRLTNDHVFQVVTDPKLADAVFTDRIGEAFETQMEAPVPAARARKGAAACRPRKRTRKRTSRRPTVCLRDTVNKQSDPSLNSAFGRGKGTVFLVDVKSRQVIWSAYEPPKGVHADLDRTASDIVSRLKKDLQPKD